MHTHWPDTSFHHRCLRSGTMQEAHFVPNWHLLTMDIMIQQHRIRRVVRSIVEPQYHLC